MSADSSTDAPHGLKGQLTDELGLGACYPPAPTGERTSAPLRRNLLEPDRVILVDDSQSTLETVGRLLRMAGFAVKTAATTHAAIEAARAGFDLMLLDVRLGGEDGLDVLRALRASRTPGRVVVMTAFDVDGIEEEVRRLDAEFVDRWDLGDAVELVRTVLASGSPAPVARLVPPGISRWAEAVVAGLAAPQDLKTLTAWGRAIGKSRGALRELCALADVSAKRSCALVRLLRAVHLSSRTGRFTPARWLDFSDRRSLKRLLVDGGVAADTSPSLGEVLKRQRLVTDEVLIVELHQSLRRAGLLTDEE